MTVKTQNLYVKSFFASSVQEGIERARKELGPDALLLNSRESPPEARHLGEYETVFGCAPDVLSAASPPAPTGGEDLRSEIDEIRGMLKRLTAPQAKPHEQFVERALCNCDVDATIAREINDAVRQRLGRRGIVDIAERRNNRDDDPDTWLRETLAEVSSRIEIRAEVGRITALVGPPGAGKTTTLVKLAVAQGLAAGKPVQFISTDTHRIGGAEQLKTYAWILGVPFQAVENVTALAQAIDAARPQSMLFIDTPGYSAALLDELGGDMAAFLCGRQDIDTQLVLTASMRTPDLRRTAESYSRFGVSKLLFTRLDETSSYGAMFSECAYQKKPLSFVSGGQLVPEDLEPACKEKIAESLVRKLPSMWKAAA